MNQYILSFSASIQIFSTKDDGMRYVGDIAGFEAEPKPVINCRYHNIRLFMINEIEIQYMG